MGFKFASSWVRSLFNSGSAAVPSISFAGDENTGIYSPGADQVGIATAGTARVVVDNAGLITGTGTSLGAWNTASYTPSISGTGWAIGDGTITGRYCQVGKIVHFNVSITFGASSTYGSGQLTVSLPVTASGSMNTNAMAGQAVDTSASKRYLLGGFGVGSTTTITIRSLVTATNGELTSVISTAPFTWASTDVIGIAGTYEAA